jgi:hypothetical protein
MATDNEGSARQTDFEFTQALIREYGWTEADVIYLVMSGGDPVVAYYNLTTFGVVEDVTMVEK